MIVFINLKVKDIYLNQSDLCFCKVIVCFVSFTAFIQSESIIEVLRFDDGGLLQVILF